MKRSARALALLMLCSAAVSACKPERIESASVLRPDRTNPERFICESAGTRPAVQPEHRIDWARVASVAQAKAEHEKFITVLRDREGRVADYVIRLETANFTCRNNMAWQRDYYAGLPAEPE